MRARNYNSGVSVRRAPSGEKGAHRPVARVQGAQVLDRAFTLVNLIGDHNREGLALAQLCRLSGLTHATTHRLLRALERQAILERDPTSSLYHLGSELAILGALSAMRHALEPAAAPSLVYIAEQTEDTALLTVRRGWRGLCIAREEGVFPIRAQIVGPGDSQPLGVTSGSMAILATLSDTEVDESIAINMKELKDKYPIYTRRLLKQQVEETRANGYAVNPGQLIKGSTGIAVAIIGPNGLCAGALSIAGIDSRLAFPRRKELVAVANSAAEQVARRLMGRESRSQSKDATPGPRARNSLGKESK